LAELLIEKEVITSEDVEAILGARPWTSRTDEIIEANEAMKQEGDKAKGEEKPKKKRAPRKKKEEALVNQEPETKSQDEMAENSVEENKS
jgi:cell division protease FtsH